MKIKKVILTLGMGIIFTFTLTTNVKANVQSRPNATSLTSTTASQFFALIRKMESSTGPMGLQATINDAGTETSESNNIDVHMIKNTEWGTAAMLAASSYGSAPSGNSSASTTGNASGIYQMADSNYEYVAGMWNVSNSYNTNIYNADEKYWNKYLSATSKLGDATLETKGWKNASSSNFVSSSYPVFGRSYNALFGYIYVTGDSLSRCSSRAAVVCGAGL